ncbi:hypothetical protein AGOR_G00101040 [Albula goreensis]|uniref:ALK and LTK ligand 2 n=1 Tax=Albula goreensis TaxID=1534307 RepID=A0A8T3DF75_9TELE|nr:hypothetical protein AGOR_G00101040 [Albula goreensis]
MPGIYNPQLSQQVRYTRPAHICNGKANRAIRDDAGSGVFNSQISVAMSAQRTPVYMGLILLISTAGYSKQATAPTGATDNRSLFQLIIDRVRHAKEQRADDGDGLLYSSNKQDYSVDTKEVHDYKSYPDDHVLEVFPRDLRQKEKFLKHLTGPLYFSPKCSKYFYRLYHNSRDCTIPAYYKRCARLLTRLAGSQRCSEG